MDILITELTEEFLKSRVSEFVEILEDYPHEYWREEHFLAKKDQKYDLSVVALKEEEITGYIIASLKNKEPYVHKFFVKKEFRNRSIGEKMLLFFENRIREKGYRTTKLAVREDNEHAIRFYLRNEFKVTGKRPDSADNSNLLIMTREVPDRL